MIKHDIQLLAAVKTIKNSHEKTFEIIENLRAENAELKSSNHQAQHCLEIVQKEILNLKSSRSWRLTQPLRKLKSLLTRAKRWS